MSAQDYYGGSNNQSYGGYRQQPFPPQQQQQQQQERQGYGGGYGGGDYDGTAPPASYGETLDQNRRHGSPYSQSSGGRYTPGSTPSQAGYDRPTHPPGSGQYGPQGGYGYQQGGYIQQGENYGGRYGEGSDRYAGYPPPQSPPQGQYVGRPGEGQEGDRGFLGAVAGGAAGAYGGHKLGHGVIGTVGGAIAGSVLEDHVKDKRKEKKEHEMMEQQMRMQQQQQQHYNRPPPPHPNAGNFRGNFSASSTQISLDRDFDLIASCGGMDGRNHLTSVNLNDCLTNEWGHLKWERGGNFGASARSVRLVDNGRVLEAELGNGNGGWNISHIYLDERITNENGELKFLD